MELLCWGCCCKGRKKHQGLRKNHLSSKWTRQRGFLLVTSSLKKCSILVLVDFETERSALLLPISAKPKFQPLSSSRTHRKQQLHWILCSVPKDCIQKTELCFKAKVRLMTIQMRSHNQRPNVMVVKNVGLGSQALNPYSPQIAL